jgi:hypothetical protein
MIKKITVVAFLIICNLYPQTIYELTPGTKGNEIALTVTNVSETSPAANVTIKPHPTLSKGEGFQEKAITFHQSEQTIEILNPKEEKEVTFVFDVSRNAQINKKDTIDFMITSSDGIIDTIISVTDQTFKQNWLSDLKFKNDLQSIMQSAKINLLAGDSLACRVQVKEFQDLVDNVYKDSLNTDPRFVTIEGWKFLYWNAQYILDRLPEY